MAGSGRRTFAAGEVLTASNVMNYLQDQAVMRFAGTAARGSAIGSAVAEGMVTYLDDTNTIETYSGSAWERQTGGLIPISPTTYTVVTGTGAFTALGQVSFTGATSVSLNGVFSSTFKNYRIGVFVNSSASALLELRLRNASTDSTSGYFYGGMWSNSNSAYGAWAANALGKFNLAEINTGLPTSANIEFGSPAVATFTSVLFETVDSLAGYPASLHAGGYHQSAAAYDGFTLGSTSGTITGYLTVYGYND